MKQFLFEEINGRNLDRKQMNKPICENLCTVKIIYRKFILNTKEFEHDAKISRNIEYVIYVHYMA